MLSNELIANYRKKLRQPTLICLGLYSENNIKSLQRSLQLSLCH